jgi:thiaminase/transcriptional activator TenA
MDFVDECLEFAAPAWDAYVHHPWVEALFAGTLDQDRFHYWLAQDLSFIYDTVGLAAVPKCPPDLPWAKRMLDYFANSRGGRAETILLEKYGDFAKTPWAARPAREAFNNFMLRVASEGTFGEFCCAQFACTSFSNTFALRYEETKPEGIPQEQVDWVMQFAEPWEREGCKEMAQAINEAGTYASPWLRDQMRWTFLRGTQHQIATFDAAWKMSDPWPGPGDDGGVLATQHSRQ